MFAKLFVVPDGIPLRMSLIELLRRISLSSFGVYAVSLSKRAMTPATCGVAIEVPEMLFVDVLESFHEEIISTPGAKTSTQLP